MAIPTLNSLLSSMLSISPFPTDRVKTLLSSVVQTAGKTFTLSSTILVGVACFALQPNLAVTVTVISFCKPRTAKNIQSEMHKISNLFTAQKVGYAALVLFLAWYALPITQCMITSYLAIQLGIHLRVRAQR